MNLKAKKTQYLAFAILLIFLFTTGYQTEVIGFLQRGVLATGLANPDVEKSDTTAQAQLNFNVIDESGSKISLSNLKGKTIFINLWATWCPPCIAEMPGIQDLYEEMNGGEVAFVLINMDDDFSRAKAFMQRKGYTLPIYKVDSYFPKQFKTGSLPSSFVINAKGELVFTHVGLGNFDTPSFKDFLIKHSSVE